MAEHRSGKLTFAIDDRVETPSVLVEVKDRRAQIAQHGLPLGFSQSGDFKLSKKLQDALALLTQLEEKGFGLCAQA